MNQNLSYLTSSYLQIKNQRKKYGELKKCEFHLHTPASHDYKLYKDKDYNSITEEEIVSLAFDVNYITEETMQQMLEKIDDYKNSNYITQYLQEQNKPFQNFKEYFSYMLVAHKLYTEKIEAAVISDHNTVKGYEKLKYALEEYFLANIKNKKKQSPIHLFLGVEISCSEHNHLVSIFDEKDYKKVEEFLDKYIMKEDGGTYLDSLTVIKNLKEEKIEALTYLAHLNNSKYYGSGIYNNFLFSKENFQVFGLTNLSSKEKVYNKIQEYNKEARNQFGIIHEGDAHSINEIGIKNTWIKFNYINFKSLKRAFDNFSINIYPIKPEKSNKFINGLVIYSGTEGFLGEKSSKEKNKFAVDFSRDLNCVIGGRGTGKSTLLNMIECAFSLEIDTLEKLEVVSKHEKMHVVFTLNQTEYILEFVPQVLNPDKNYYLESPFAEKSITPDTDLGKITLSHKWISLFRLENEEWKELKSSESKKILEEFYNRSYSINQIIADIDNGKIGNLIKSTILKKERRINISSFILKARKHETFLEDIIVNDLRKVRERFNKRKTSIHQSIEEFNSQNKSVLEIVQSPNIKNPDTYLKSMLEVLSSEKEIEKFQITYDDIARYIYDYSKKNTYIEFLTELFSERYTLINSKLNFLNYCNENSSIYVSNKKDSFKLIEKELKEITDREIPILLALLKDRLSNQLKTETLESIVNWFEVSDEFSLKFNINKRESHRNEAPLLKNIEEMSLGQKVAAILSFIFIYGKYSNDNSPLLIDQPEDNLDNQYIYKNLVESLKNVKNNRQVIIVTHNSTIVTNSETEQVIVLDSNDKNGWVEKLGYPTDPKVTKLIINYLEGGIDSFKHKMESYSTILNNFD